MHPVALVPHTTYHAADRPRPGDVPTAHTPMSLQDAAGALATAWKRIHGTEPPDGLIPILAGQVSIETGGGRGMLNYNFGGIKGSGPSGMAYRAKTTEGWGASQVHIVDRFRAYATADEGAEDYVRLLERRFGKAVDRASNGDAPGFVAELKKAGYFTGDERVYAQVVSRVSQQLEASPSPTPVDVARTPMSLAAARPHPSAPMAARAQASASQATAAAQSQRDEMVLLSALTTMLATDEVARSALRIACDDHEARRLTL